MKIILSYLLVALFNGASYLYAENAKEEDHLKALIEQAIQNNPKMRSIVSTLKAAKLEDAGTGYLPDPMIKYNYFGSPVETRNGPQTANLMFSQRIPWLSTLDSMELMSKSKAGIQEAQRDLFSLEITYQMKTLNFKNILLNKKLQNKDNILSSLEKLTKVVLARIKVGKARQADLSRINIEIGKLTQKIRELKSQKFKTLNQIERLLGDGKENLPRPQKFTEKFLELNADFKPANFQWGSHPILEMSKKKIEMTDAGIKLEKSKRLPMFELSATWIQIDEPEGMASPDAGKDAWAIGAGITLPLWGGKYSSLTESKIAEKASAQESFQDALLELKTSLKNLHDEYLAAKDINSIYKDDILPQAQQSLGSDQLSYQQGTVSFDRVVDNYMRLIRLEDAFEENTAKLANLKAGIEKIAGKEL